MAKFRIVIHTSNKRKDGSYPVCLRITKNGKLKYIYLNLSAFENEWDKNADRFKRDKRMNPNYESYNNWLISCEERKNEVVNKFMKAQVDWTLNQFEEEFLGISRQGKIYDYWMRQVEDLKATGHIGNGKVYERDLHLFCKYDSKAKERLFSEIDVKYINRLNMAMEKNGCCGNTRMHTLKTLRAVINKAIKEKAASNNTYPFGKGGFEINKLAEETAKRYLLPTDLELIKNSPQQNLVLERARRIYLFSYYCFGMSFVDMANLTINNIEMLDFPFAYLYKYGAPDLEKDPLEAAEFFRCAALFSKDEFKELAFVDEDALWEAFNLFLYGGESREPLCVRSALSVLSDLREKRSPYALYLTGEIYHKGLYGEDIDLEVAYSFYQEAADLGCEEAEEVLNLKPSDSIRHCK